MYNYKRGDTNGDNAVTIVDALFIAQYVIGIRPLSTINAVNAASPKNDDADGQPPWDQARLNIADALLIAQYLALMRDDYYVWLAPGPGGPQGPSGPESPDSEAIVEVGGVQVPQNQSAPVPITVRSITDPDGLGAYEFQVTFDPAIIRVDSVQPGQAPFDGVTSSIDNTNGVVLLTYFHTSAPGPTSDTVVAYLNVTAIGNPWDISLLDVTITTLSDTQGDDMPAWDMDGYVMVTP